MSVRQSSLRNQRPLLYADHCHCSMCRRQHGTAFSTYAEFSSENFRWASGEDHVKVYEISKGAGWCFCIECGSSLATRWQKKKSSFFDIQLCIALAFSDLINTASVAIWGATSKTCALRSSSMNVCTAILWFTI